MSDAVHPKITKKVTLTDLSDDTSLEMSSSTDEKSLPTVTPPSNPPRKRGRPRKSVSDKVEKPPMISHAVKNLRKRDLTLCRNVFAEDEEEEEPPKSTYKKKMTKKVITQVSSESSDSSMDSLETSEDSEDTEEGKYDKTNSDSEALLTLERPRTRMREKRNCEKISFDKEWEKNYKVPKKKKVTTPTKAYSPVPVAPNTIDKVLNYRKRSDKKDIGLKELATFNFEKEAEFEVKWGDMSYRHNTWVTLETSKDMKGYLKLKNYIKTIRLNGEMYANSTAEEIEAYNIELESQQALVESYKRVERIVSVYLDEGKTYFVKWVGLQYGECSWESEGDLTLPEDKEAIRQFYEREQETLTKKAEKLKRRFIKYVDDENAKLKLRDYQIEGVNWLTYAFSKNVNVILADEMGLGKTIQTITFLRHLYDKCNYVGPHLVVVPLSTINNWAKEFAKWAPRMNCIVYTGDGESRAIIRKTEMESTSKKPKFNVLLTTFELVIKDQGLLNLYHWGYLAVDEAHRLKNAEGQLYEALLNLHTECKLLITGTPLQNTLKELWSLLHFLHPEQFPNFEDFEKTHKVNAAEELQKFHSELKPYILRRMKKEVEKSLPPKKERILRVGLSGLQKQYYRWIITKNESALKKAVKQQKMSLMNIMIELKKLCNHPLLINQSISYDEQGLIESCGKMVLLDKLLVELKKDGHRVLIFSQMVRMLDILAEYMKKRGFSYQRLDGSMGKEPRQRAMEQFNAKDSRDFCFLLSTRAGGLGINLTSADTVIIYDSDWNPQNDLQAQARCHRIGQEKMVNIYRLVTEGSVEEKILMSAKKKMVLDHLVIQTMEKKKKNGKESFEKDEIDRIIKFGAANIFGKDEGEQKKVDLEEIMKRGDEREEKSEDDEDELLGAFNVENFAIGDGKSFWDKVIQEEDEKEAKRLDYEILGIEEKKEAKDEKSDRKRKVEKEDRIDEKIVKSVLKGMKRFGFHRREEVVKCVKRSMKKDNVALEEIVNNLCERISASCDSLDGDGHIRDIERYVEGVKFSPFELKQKNEEMKMVGILIKYMDKHNDKLPFELKTPQWSVEIDWKAEFDGLIVRGIKTFGLGMWSDMGREDEGVQKVIAAGATPMHIQRRAEIILKETKELVRRKMARDEKRKRTTGIAKSEQLKDGNDINSVSSVITVSKLTSEKPIQKVKDINNEHEKRIERVEQKLENEKKKETHSEKAQTSVKMEEESETDDGFSVVIHTCDEWLVGYDKLQCLSKLEKVKDCLKKLRYLKTHPDIEAKLAVRKLDRYLGIIKEEIDKYEDEEKTYKQLWYYVSTFTNMSMDEVLEASCVIRKRKEGGVPDIKNPKMELK
ncbi:CHD3-type chromatin-remodeling factor PICKLE, putative [Entamoeba invadens IP1]|uniref:CHD3-type chromatin-remodeling factor PICKLE, putative n=1 Tax=Entamoeba invadens IP1 TaxID=370355 RepID=A0A0A1U5Y6_ENTIV|nr:CHD3-type chromatin-remodeling factor PICKLE, putative [Entamoeba invadens IP1]ELP89787.1 CHD3-type chromatin-remodeling factor PICKLE, putative [Entamoeba invadens IP1]|eukprot:XP_004256558.1 CHD3-type chromatin-remodeling factor PICKLE, putative [Entamoeba invadens IP1]